MNARKYSLTGSAVLLLMLAGGVRAQSAAQIVRVGNESYRAGNYDEALKQYQRPLLEGPEDPVIQYNQANCYYKLDDLEQAMNLYRAVAAESRNMDLVARSKFNLGNCYFQQGMKQRDSDLQKAVEAFTTSIQQYREVLKIHPDDPDAI
ncbi:MAG TPA: tetratricopeptide repeat protein, partial [Anaerohalosphaeraceae bacterium]|nr:tetratricopeptide repeat protein [Anaerohalosphaeraceae bacterium]